MRRLVQAVAVTAIALVYMPFAVAHDAHETASFGAAGDAAKASRTIAITMNDMRFEPSALSITADETIRFVITNRSAIDHEFALGDAESQAAHRHMMAMMEKTGMTMRHHDPNIVSVGAGETKELTWHFTAAGRYEFDCNIPGHYEAGMTGAIIVAPKV